MKLKDVFNNTMLLKVPRYAKISEVLELMKKNGLNFVLIVNDKEDIIGIATRSIILRSLANGISSNDPISKVMIKNIITVNGEEDLIDIFIFMMKNNIKHLLAINENGKAIGVVTLKDILSAINKECESSLE
ncbi:CBS domain-containing protein [Sulfolobus tengchongensis]|uniref:CBS domain-containing protein n=1 Tax=Sulfolobus tengchongensis TaxID=207809 RepID=A0AAX4L5Y1_9CREN